MAYTTTDKIIKMGFDWQNFDVPDGSAFVVLVANTLEEQVTLIKIDVPNYDTANDTEKLILAEAEKLKTAAALKRLEASLAGNVSQRAFGAPAANGENYYKTAQQFENSANIWLAKIGVAKNMVNEGGGIASAVVVS